MSTVDAMQPRRALAAVERHIVCRHCGRVDIPLNEAETWHYVRTGEGLTVWCPDGRVPPRCKWEDLPEHEASPAEHEQGHR